MKQNFTAEFFEGNRKRLRELFTGTAPIVIAGNAELQRGGDTAFPFQQDASFWYLTGIDEPDAVLVMERTKEYLILPMREGVRAAFDGSIIVDDLIRQSGISTILDEREGWKQLSDRLQKVRHVATIAATPAYMEDYGMFANPARRRLISKLKDEASAIELLDVGEHMMRLRMIKQPEEIRAIEQAIAISCSSIKDAIRSTKRDKYAYEFELEAELYRGFRARGARGHAFDPIVASGKNATTIHYLQNNSALSADELVVLDVGAEFDHYAADITRTIAIGEPTRRQSQVFDAVLDVQQYAYSLLKPGTTMREYEHAIELYMGEKLRELGLIKTIDSESVRTYYPHATSHHLGLNVHDVADYSLPLGENMIITVEPGIYVPEEGLGVRIEDDIRITADGIEILTRSLPASLK